MKQLRQIYGIAVRECGIICHNHIYWLCMVVFPLLVMFFFTAMMYEGKPLKMPVGVVDLDNSSTTRSIIRRLDAFQTSHIVARYPSVAEARKAIQENQIYAFLYIPEGTTDDLMASRQPKMSFYYTQTSLVAGSLLFSDLKTISTLASAAVGQATLLAKGFTDEQAQTFLQPIKVDLHPLNNPTTDYNVYLSTMLVPGLMMLFMFLITPYSIGTELKFGRSKQWMEMADNKAWVALIGKFTPHALVFLILTMTYAYYVYGILGFPHPGGTLRIIMLTLLQVFSSLGFGIFMFGLMPSLRMSMSTCSLWAVLSFSMVGSAFPVMAMDGALQSLAWLFPLRHYFMIYQTCIFNDYPLADAWSHIAVLVAFALLPILVAPKIRNAMLNYVYIP